MAEIKIDFELHGVRHKREWYVPEGRAIQLAADLAVDPNATNSINLVGASPNRVPERKQSVIRLILGPDGLSITGTEAFQVDLTREADSVILELRP